jgi:hypothetical protein
LQKEQKRARLTGELSYNKIEENHLTSYSKALAKKKLKN